MRYAAMSAVHLPSYRDTFLLIPGCSGRINSVSTDFDNSLGSGGDFAVEEVLHLLEFKLTAGQTGTSIDSLDIVSQQIISKCLE